MISNVETIASAHVRLCNYMPLTLSVLRACRLGGYEWVTELATVSTWNRGADAVWVRVVRSGSRCTNSTARYHFPWHTTYTWKWSRIWSEEASSCVVPVTWGILLTTLVLQLVIVQSTGFVDKQVFPVTVTRGLTFPRAPPPRVLESKPTCYTYWSLRPRSAQCLDDCFIRRYYSICWFYCLFT